MHTSIWEQEKQCAVRDAELHWEGELCSTNEFEEWQGEVVPKVMEVGCLHGEDAVEIWMKGLHGESFQALVGKNTRPSPLSRCSPISKMVQKFRMKIIGLDGLFK
jgi:hypothetical protein